MPALFNKPRSTVNQQLVTGVCIFLCKWLDGRDDSKVLSELFGGSRRLVRLPARETIVSATRNDPARPRWVRVTTGASCSFCLMIASRGAVYSSDTVKFNAHDHCRCMVTPVFNSRLSNEKCKLNGMLSLTRPKAQLKPVNYGENTLNDHNPNVCARLKFKHEETQNPAKMNNDSPATFETDITMSLHV